MAWRIVRGELLFALCASVMAADEVPIGYPQAMLAERAPIYREGIESNLRGLLLQRMTPQERAELGALRLDIPLGGGLSGYRAMRRGGKSIIELPAESLRFFSDLCSATAWLAARGYSLSTIQDYLGMLKYGRAEDLGLASMPLPLDALQIPDTDLDDPGVESRRSACFSTGVVFIVAHELGHLVLGHEGYQGISRKEAQAHEAAADAFAIELFSRFGDLPLGALYYFSYFSILEKHRGDFSSDADWEAYVMRSTHPISPQRVASLADSLDNHAARFSIGRPAAFALSTEIRTVADALTDTDIQQLVRLQGQTVRPYMLAPRREHVWMVSPPDKPLPAVEFSGYFTGTLGPKDPDKAVPAALVLYRDADKVSGRYSYAGIGGTLSGRIRDGRLEYSFREAQGKGRGQIEHLSESEIRGRFASDGGLSGSFALQRQGI